MEKTKKIMSIQGGGITDVAFLTFLLNLSQYYDKKNIDLLSLFDVFSGVSSGSIIVTAFALREQFLKNMATVNPQIIREALIKLAYSESQIVATIIALKNMAIKNCSTIIIVTLIFFYENLSPEIFFRTTLRKIVSLNGLLFAKYGDNKKNVFNKYFNFTLKDVPQDRSLVIKSINIPAVNIVVYTNFIAKNPNDIFVNNPEQSLSEAVNFSTEAPTYFPYTKLVDGGVILNTVLLAELFLFYEYNLEIYKLNVPALPVNIPVFDGLIGWLAPIINIGINYENNILCNLIKYQWQQNFFKVDFPIQPFPLDDLNNIAALEKIGNNISIDPSVVYIDTIILRPTNSLKNSKNNNKKQLKSNKKNIIKK